ncbi:MAG: phospholipase D-like domain-containing protein [Oscillospiraceae bacterium]|nr:phospholipase D-like domain-containing protein [Oscillospiraceae bacterium]
MKYVFKLANLIILSVVLQMLYLFALVYTMANLSPLIHVTMTAFGILCVFFILSGRDAAVYRLSWSVLILLLPAVMGVVYLFYNRRITGRKIEAELLSARKNSQKYSHKYPVQPSDSLNNSRLAVYIEKTTGIPPASYYEAEYFPQGEDFLKRFLEELERSEKYIFIEFFIIEQGKMWGEILEVLKRKISAGVEVRLTYDGSATLYTLPRGYYKTMRKMGIKCVVFNPLRSLISFRANLRNHRKLAVIDGVTAFCGGLNLCDNYINANPKAKSKTGHWKDSAVMVKGQAAWNFTLSFLAMWEFITRQREDYTPFIPNQAGLSGENAASVWHDIPLDNEPVSERILLNFVNRAENYVYIITPYLAPSEEIMSALAMAAKMGVDVRIMLPFLPDKFVVQAISKSNYLPLLEAGVRIFEYPPGFIHSKNIVSDDERAAVSTVNFDYRALYMHHECGICFYSKAEAASKAEATSKAEAASKAEVASKADSAPVEIITKIKQDFEKTQKNSHEVTLAEHNNTGLFQKGVRRICKILEPLV